MESWFRHLLGGARCQDESSSGIARCRSNLVPSNREEWSTKKWSLDSSHTGGQSEIGRTTEGLTVFQIVVGLPFLTHNAEAYLTRAFEFSRQFLFKWTVNWRFIGEEEFLSARFSRLLIIAHVSLLALFITTCWLKPSRQSLLETIRQILSPASIPSEKQAVISQRVTRRYVLTTMLASMAIGSLCARSLHYQFYSWIVWATPFLWWRAGFHPILQYAFFLQQEWAWNVYPSTDLSSIAVVQILAVTVVGIWYATSKEDLESGASTKNVHVE